MTEWQINIREEALPLIEALSLRVPTAPTSFLRQLCKKQRIAIDGTPASAEKLTKRGETIIVKSSQRWTECLEKLAIQPDQILYEDSGCMVLNKPAGLAIHHAEGHEKNLLHCVQDFLYFRKETFQVAPIHRLDIGTSGAVLFGKGRATISQLGQMVMAGQLSKRYLALVSGQLNNPGALEGNVPAKGKSKEALTRYQPLAVNDGYTLLELELVTGRYHQIRYQLASAGHPIVGDTRYRGKLLDGIDRPFLHCHELAFPRPDQENMVTTKAGLPLDLKNLLAALGFGSESFQTLKG